MVRGVAERSEHFYELALVSALASHLARWKWLVGFGIVVSSFLRSEWVGG